MDSISHPRLTQVGGQFKRVNPKGPLESLGIITFLVFLNTFNFNTCKTATYRL